MSCSNLIYDQEAYDISVQYSSGPGNYQLENPCLNTSNCYNSNPSIRMQRSGVSVHKKNPLIDIDSELMGLNYKMSKNISDKYEPQCNQNVDSGYPCGQGVIEDCNVIGTLPGSRPDDVNLKHKVDCHFPTEYTRLSNPVCNTRGIGINRWEWLCKDPQDHVIIPFEYNINNRLVTKDNFKPCLPKPMSQYKLVPRGGKLPCEPIHCNNMLVPTSAPSVTWRTVENCSTVKPCAVPTGPSSISWKRS